MTPPRIGEGGFFSEKEDFIFFDPCVSHPATQPPVRSRPLHLSTRACPSQHGPARAFSFCLRCLSIGAYNEAERVTQLGG